jgi:hypothetical protein
MSGLGIEPLQKYISSVYIATMHSHPCCPAASYTLLQSGKGNDKKATIPDILVRRWRQSAA